jgi:hypothetical protein
MTIVMLERSSFRDILSGFFLRFSFEGFLPVFFPGIFFFGEYSYGLSFLGADRIFRGGTLYFID